MNMMKRTPVVTWITTAAVLFSMCAGLTFSRGTAAQNGSDRLPTGRETLAAVDVKYPTLSKYATDLTQLALDGKLELGHGLEARVDRVVASLATPTKAPLMLGESDLDRDTIVRGVAARIAFGEVPEALRHKLVFRLNLEAIAKGLYTIKEFEARVQSVFAEAEKADGKIILFVDQLQQYA